MITGNKTSLFEKHIQLKAKMVPYAGYQMPVEYTGVINEHMAVREHVGLFDVSHMGEIWVKGEKALDLLQYITTNDASLLSPGDCQYSCFPNGKGGIIDDLIIYHYQENKYMLVVNAANINKDYTFIIEHNKSFNCEIENASDKISLLALQGPKAEALLQELTSIQLAEIKSFGFKTGSIQDAPDVIISRTGYTGAGGFELYFYNQHAEKLWDYIVQAGKKYNIQPVGLAARDTLRLEKGYSLYGNDIDDTTSPIEAGLGWATKLNKKADFIDKAFLKKQKENGVEQKLVGFVLQQRGIPRKDYQLSNKNGEIIGRVTSGTNSPVLKKGIGMGYVNTKYAKSGECIFVNIRNKQVEAEVTRPPFV